MKTTFSVTSYFDPYGDGKSDRKVLSRTFYETDKTPDQVKAVYSELTEKYYSGVSLRFKPYKKTKIWGGAAR